MYRLRLISSPAARGMCLAAIVAAALAVLPGSAAAARRTVPENFFRMVMPPLMVGQPDAALEQQVGLMASSVVEAVRISIGWAQLEPVRGQYAFGPLDGLVRAVAKHHLHAVINVA